MADLEKTIAGLKDIANCLYPYIGSTQIRACLDAIELLREQEPVSVGFTNGVYHCGNCGEPLFDNNIYCFRCGRKVEWGDDGDE